ncbi:cell division protein FtsX [Bdellovibrio sp. HCB185ZH]|uniref:cell division protein FtsX n=1 Tax=Bdellovibrio sp. HCB185ZH TaxID=3394235 RepID=UPI0039A4CDB2
MNPTQKNLALKFSTLIVVTACFAVMATSLLISKNFRNILTHWGEDVQLTVYLSTDISAQGRDELEKYFKSHKDIGHFNLVTQDQALSDFRAQLASYAPDISKDDELLKMIPSSYQVKLKTEIATDAQSSILQSIATELKGRSGIDDVSYGQDWVEKYSAFVSAINLALNLVGIVVLCASIFVMSNAIRASVQVHRDEIVVLEMIGATASMIRKPFLKEGALLGLVASALSMAIAFGMYTVGKSIVNTRLSFLRIGEQVSFISPWMVAVVIIGGTVMGALASYLCVRKINDGYAAASQRA